MAEYIDREKLKRDLIDNRSFYPAIVKNAIENAPTEDVVPRSEVIAKIATTKQEVAREIFEEIESFIESDRGKVICEDNSNDWFAKDRAKTFETYHNIGVEDAKNTLRDFLDELKKEIHR